MEDAALENENVDMEDAVITEHNGVYGGKWHIVSPEGFNLPEGLEYLKNSWEGSIEERISFNRKEIFKYSVKIKVCHIDLYTSLKRVSSLLKDAWSYRADVEFKDCPRNVLHCRFRIYECFLLLTN